jgi:hypothetical protein
MELGYTERMSIDATDGKVEANTAATSRMLQLTKMRWRMRRIKEQTQEAVFRSGGEESNNVNVVKQMSTRFRILLQERSVLRTFEFQIFFES